MRKAVTLSDLFPFKSAKSFIEVTNVVNFWSKRIMYDGRIRLVQKYMDCLLEVYMIMYIDTIAVARKKTSPITNGEPAALSNEIDGKPRHQSAAPNVTDLDDVGL
jgi:hypothetical protein